VWDGVNVQESDHSYHSQVYEMRKTQRESVRECEYMKEEDNGG